MMDWIVESLQSCPERLMPVRIALLSVGVMFVIGAMVVQSRSGHVTRSILSDLSTVRIVVLLLLLLHVVCSMPVWDWKLDFSNFLLASSLLLVVYGGCLAWRLKSPWYVAIYLAEVLLLIGTPLSPVYWLVVSLVW